MELKKLKKDEEEVNTNIKSLYFFCTNNKITFIRE